MKAVTLVAGVCLLATAGSVGAHGTQVQRPQLTLTDTRPFEIRGTGFEPRERVQVLLAANGAQQWRNTVASSAGAFTVQFRLALGTCSRFTMHAFGSQGSRARVVPRRSQIDCVSPG